jgi:hypothetical protein
MKKAGQLLGILLVGGAILAAIKTAVALAGLWHESALGWTKVPCVVRAFEVETDFNQRQPFRIKAAYDHASGLPSRPRPPGTPPSDESCGRHPSHPLPGGSWPELIRLTATAATAAVLLERAATPHVDRLRAELEQRFRRCRGNLRELLLECYDDLAGRKLL